MKTFSGKTLHTHITTCITTCIMTCITTLMLTMCATPCAFAFKKSKTCDPTGGIYACRNGQKPLAINWNTRTLHYHINSAGTQDIPNGPDNKPNTKVIEAIQNSFKTWDFVDCAYFTFEYSGLTDSNFIGFDKNSVNKNIITFQNNWNTNDGNHNPAAYALTTVTFSPNTGKIQDADIEFNDQYWQFTNSNNPLLTSVDIQNTGTHEIGHFLGLDHSEVSGATMLENADLGELSKRDLHQDDIDGICSIYTPLAASALESEDGSCCTTTPAHPQNTPYMLILVLFFATCSISHMRRTQA